MKKLLIGCGIVLLLVVIAVIGVGIWGYMVVSDFVGGWSNATAAVEQLDADFPFTAPADDSLDANRLEAYFAFRREFYDYLSADPTVSKMLSDDPQVQQSIGPGELISFGTAGIPTHIEKMAELLRAREMSPREAGWQMRTMVGTITRAAREGDQRMQTLLEDLNVTLDQFNSAIDEANNSEAQQARVDLEQIAAEAEDIPQAELQENVELIAERRDELTAEPKQLFIDFIIMGVSGGMLQHQGQGGAQPAGAAP